MYLVQTLAEDGWSTISQSGPKGTATKAFNARTRGMEARRDCRAVRMLDPQGRVLREAYLEAATA